MGQSLAALSYQVDTFKTIRAVGRAIDRLRVCSWGRCKSGFVPVRTESLFVGFIGWAGGVQAGFQVELI